MKKCNRIKQGLKCVWMVGLLWVVSCGVVKADHVIRGRLVDGQTKTDLPGASVVIEGTRQGVVTALDGTFVLKTEQTGSFTLECKSIGFKSLRVEVNARADREIDLGVLTLDPDVIGLRDVVVTSSLAIRRKTPVALSVINPVAIENKLGNQEFPEILKSTPGVYATKHGGGYGDSRINLRGFESENVAVMINGVPMNEMEWGGMYWSNWLGLSDVTRSLQVQRGLGASKVSAPSVGGSLNIVTMSAEQERGGSFTYGMGNDGYHKIGMHLSSGLRRGWAVSVLGSKTWGDGYIQGTDFEAYTYFINISKQFSDSHLLSFTAFGSPQKHNRRTDDLLISEWEKQPKKYRYNASYGFDMNGQRKTTVLNDYHKPQLSLNHLWTIDSESSLSTVLYASFGRGGGYSAQGYTNADRNKWAATTTKGEVSQTFRAPDGTYDFGAIYALNQAHEDGSLMAMGNSINNHDWYGLISTYTTRMGNYFDFYGGVDLRYYKGYHTAKLVDLYGGAYFNNRDNRRNVKHKADDTEWVNEKLQVGDIVYRDYDGLVLQEGAFGQVEYNRARLSAFVSASLSNTTYWRYDRFYYDKANARSDKEHFLGYTVKGGANYNLNEYHNVFMNIGNFSRAPFLSDGVFLQKEVSNAINRNAENEKVFSFELGYGLRSAFLTANLNLYHTLWKDKAMAAAFYMAGWEERLILNLTGVNALHQGIELDFVARPFHNLNLTGMLSLGDWRWNSNASGYAYDSQGQPITTTGAPATGIGASDHALTTVNLKGVKVGNSAQTVFALGGDYRLGDLKIGIDYTHYARHYAKFSLKGSSLSFGGIKEYETPWKLPSAGSMDINTSYDFHIGGVKATLFGNLNNVLNKHYISDAEDGADHKRETAQVYYAFGRTFSLRLKLAF